MPGLLASHSVGKIAVVIRMRQSWQQFKESRPGNRFQDRYYRRQQSNSGRFDLRRVLNIVGGITVALVSLVLAPLPGPGWATFFIGLGMLAGELRPVARSLDWGEIKLRQITLVARDAWRELSTMGRILIVLVALILAASLAYGAYYLLFGG